MEVAHDTTIIPRVQYLIITKHTMLSGQQRQKHVVYDPKAILRAEAHGNATQSARSFWPRPVHLLWTKAGDFDADHKVIPVIEALCGGAQVVVFDNYGDRLNRALEGDREMTNIREPTQKIVVVRVVDGGDKSLVSKPHWQCLKAKLPTCARYTWKGPNRSLVIECGLEYPVPDLWRQMLEVGLRLG